MAGTTTSSMQLICIIDHNFFCYFCRDVSFLYDVPKKTEHPDRPSETDPSGDRVQDQMDSQRNKPVWECIYI